LLVHRDPYAFFFRETLGFLVTGVDMPNNPHTRVCGQYSLNALSHHFGPIGDRDLPCVLGVADPDATPVVN
jgi:hypothetical protein